MTVRLAITVSADLMGCPRHQESMDFIVPDDKAAGGLARMEEHAFQQARSYFGGKFPGRSFRLLIGR